jgi:hypothetical protein
LITILQDCQQFNINQPRTFGFLIESIRSSEFKSSLAADHPTQHKEADRGNPGLQPRRLMDATNVSERFNE